MVHWPETMMTYEGTNGILFSGDMFGSFGTVDGCLFDDEFLSLDRNEGEILRYFANILGRYSVMVQKALSRISDLTVRIIASTHGPVWRNDPGKIRSMYDRWSRHETSPHVVIAYGSMYGSTEGMMHAVARSLEGAGISPVMVHNVSRSHESYILRDLWPAGALVLGTPTYNTMAFPGVDRLMRTLENKMMENRLLGVFGSYGWSGGGVKAVTEFADRTRWELVQPVVEARGAPRAEDLDQCGLLGERIAHRLLDTGA
jgi:flavorubredoxin